VNIQNGQVWKKNDRTYAVIQYNDDLFGMLAVDYKESKETEPQVYHDWTGKNQFTLDEMTQILDGGKKLEYKLMIQPKDYDLIILNFQGKSSLQQTYQIHFDHLHESIKALSLKSDRSEIEEKLRKVQELEAILQNQLFDKLHPNLTQEEPNERPPSHDRGIISWTLKGPGQKQTINEYLDEKGLETEPINAPVKVGWFPDPNYNRYYYGGNKK